MMTNLAFLFICVRASSALVRTSAFLQPVVRGQVYIFEISPPLHITKLGRCPHTVIGCSCIQSADWLFLWWLFWLVNCFYVHIAGCYFVDIADRLFLWWHFWLAVVFVHSAPWRSPTAWTWVTRARSTPSTCVASARCWDTTVGAWTRVFGAPDCGLRAIHW